MSEPSDRVARILVDVARELGSTLDIEPLLRLVIHRVAQLLDAERALCATFDDAGQPDRVVLHGMEWEGPGSPLPVSQSVLAKVVREKERVVIGDPLAETGANPFATVRQAGLKLVVAAPLFVQGRVRGLLYVDSTLHPRTDVDEHEELFDALARMVSTAVENAELFQEQRYRAQLLAELVHHLRTPLGVVIANANMLRDRKVPGEETNGMLGDILASAGRMVRIIDSTLELSRLDVGAPSPQTERVDVRAFLDEQLRALFSVAQKHGVDFVISAPSGLPAIETISDELSIVVDNLIFNAIKHAPRGTSVNVELALRDDDQPPATVRFIAPRRDFLFRRIPPLVPEDGLPFVEVSIVNYGDPIAPDLLPEVFAPYVRGERSKRGHKSSGIGLSIAAQCAHHLGGRMWVSSTEDLGTRITFTLPTSVTLGESNQRSSQF